MSWFGFGGGSKQPEAPKSYETTFDNSSSFPGHDSSNGSDFSSPMSMGGGGFEEQVQGLAQQAMVQALMFKLTERAFEQCVSKPSSSLSCEKILLTSPPLFFYTQLSSPTNEFKYLR